MNLDDISFKCTICETNLDPKDDEEEVISGYVGMIPVVFCLNCYNGLVEMIDILEDEYPSDESY